MDEENKKNPETEESSPAAAETKEKSKARKWISRIVILIILILILLFTLYRCGYIGGQEEAPFIIGANVKEGTPGMTEEEIEEALEAEQAKANFSIELNGYPTFADGSSEGNLNIVNPADNALYMEVEIRLDDTDEVIYQSGGIPPNHYIDNDKLTKVLEKGEYNATAYVSITDPDNPETQYNSASFDLIITIQN